MPSNRMVDYETMSDLLNTLRAKMRVQYNANDYDEMLKVWNQVVDYFNRCPIEMKGATSPRIRPMTRF